MPTGDKNLHGSAPAKHSVALLLIDVISDFDFPDGARLLGNVSAIVKNIAELKKRAKKENVPVVYVNDNFGKWQSDFTKLLAHCQSKSSKGNEIAGLLAPEERDYFILKPKHSAFFSTTLDLLLKHFQTKKIVLAGLSTDICVLFTASDAYLRDYKIVVPRDCVAAVDELEHEHALKYIERVLDADTRPFAKIKLK